MANKSLEGEKGLNRGKWYQTKKTYSNKKGHLRAATTISWPIKVWKVRGVGIEASGITTGSQPTRQRETYPLQQ